MRVRKLAFSWTEASAAAAASVRNAARADGTAVELMQHKIAAASVVAAKAFTCFACSRVKRKRRDPLRR